MTIPVFPDPANNPSRIFFKKRMLHLLLSLRIFGGQVLKRSLLQKALCLRAWADICTDKKIGGLGIRNFQAVNQSLILSAAWRLAKNPNDHLALVLKAKYHADTSIWRAKQNTAKSAFWAAILKVKPLLHSAAFYQIFNGNVSIWSTP